MHRSTTSRRQAALGALLAIATGLPALAEPIPLGDDIQVNTYTTSRQLNPSVEALPGGDFVVVWESVGSFGTDSSGYSIQARRFTADGAGIGIEFQVNDATSSNQRIPAVISDGTGGLVAAWADPTAGLRARAFSADGSFSGASFVINENLAGTEQLPRLARSAGEFRVAWENTSTAWSRRLSAAPAPLGAQFLLHAAEVTDAFAPDVAVDASATTVFAWSESGNSDVFVRAFDDDGLALAPASALANCTDSIQAAAQVAALPGQGFLATWVTACVNGSGGFAGRQVMARTLDSQGSPTGTEFTVSDTTGGIRITPAFDVEEGGDWVTAWHGSGQAGDGDGFGISARRMRADQSPDGPEFAVNTYTTGTQAGADIAALADGRFVVVWYSDGSSAGDDDQQGVLMRLFDPAIFRDGFEEGNDGAWDAVVG